MQAILQINDEVNVKIQGLDLKHRKYLSDKYKFEIPGARYLPVVRLGRWDGKVSYFQLGGTTYINLLPEILPYLDDQGYDIEINDTRQYNTKFNFPKFNSDTFADKSWPSGHPQAGQPIVLRDYQVEIINNFLENPQSVQEIATGAGKTLITAALSKTVESEGRTIVIVPNKSLVAQTEADYVNLGLDVGVYYGERKEINHRHVICTWQSINILLKNSQGRGSETEPAGPRLSKDPKDLLIDDLGQDVVLIMVDEVHQAKADVLKQLLTGVFSQVPLRWGLTGTIPKEDYARVSILCTLGPVVGKLSASELQEAGHLADCHVNILQLQDYAEYKDYKSELNFLTTDEKRVKFLSELVNNIKEAGNTLVLVDRIESGRKIVEALNMLTADSAVFVSGSTKSKTRQAEYDEIATSTNKIIVATYGVAAVGINIPRIFNLVLLEPGKSFVRVIQSIGRGIRRAEDKDFVQIWDITSSCKFAKRHLTQRKKFYTEANYPYAFERVEWK